MISVFILHHDKHHMCLENIEIHTEDLKLGENQQFFHIACLRLFLKGYNKLNNINQALYEKLDLISTSLKFNVFVLKV